MIEIKKHSGIYTLLSEQFIPWSLERVWSFFSHPANLARITPDKMGFQITSPAANSTYPGQIITYKIGILPGIKSNWVTEITQVETNKFFIDEQRFGPYRMWHHEHHFESTGNGVIMKDKISYKIPFGFLGHLVHYLFIRRQLLQIFAYRKLAVDQLVQEDQQI